MRTNDLLNALHYILQSSNGRELCKAFPGLLLSRKGTAEQQRDEDTASADAANPTAVLASSPETGGNAANKAEMGFLAGDDYYMAKEQLITDEQILLRILCFQMNVDSPQKYLLNLCRLLQCSQPLIQLAVCLVRQICFHLLKHSLYVVMSVQPSPDSASCLPG